MYSLRSVAAAVAMINTSVALAMAEVVLVDGAPGIVVAPFGRLFAVVRMTVNDRRITEFDVIADPAHLDQITLTIGS